MSPETQDVHYLKEVFDYKNKMVRLDYKPNIFGDSNSDVHRTSEVHDFNTGVAYVTDVRTGSCTFKLIPTKGFDAEPLANNSKLAKLRSGFEYFFSDSAINITYSGMKTTRGIECDVWVALKNDWPSDQPALSVWEWYFARRGWQQYAGKTFEFGMPIQIKITTCGPNPMYMLYNIYDYNEDIPNFWAFDISKCYNYDNKAFIRFFLPGNYSQLVLPNESIFKYLVLISITGYTAISPIRVANMKLDHNSKYILVSFDMLGPAPIKGDVRHYQTETPLTIAKSILMNAINKQTFVVEVDKISLSTCCRISFEDEHTGTKLEDSQDVDIADRMCDSSLCWS
ncbi:uncharacterized protein LOC121373150 [Gigantopelta aegis]|uniref:uncharacterized protein LOC121373150 n=1 Tax=Gigantopelta aegis TaxID=1735272 RepID=UPI001B88B5AB|nr:uncharacterized protein LOC121373150 [Gigantopelta aegis]